MVFIHGATYGSTHTFDYEIEGESWMDHMAGSGFDVWCLDLLGYGQSDRPKVMLEPAENNNPIVDTAHAVAELDLAINFICGKRHINSVSLIGYSWGSAISGSYAGKYPEKIHGLVLSGALWVSAGSQPRSINASPGAYRMVEVQAAMSRWASGLTQAELDVIVPPARVQKWSEDTVLSDPQASEFNPPRLKAPTGVLKDFQHYASSGEPWYDPGSIKAPTLIVVGELDRETTPEQGRAIFTRLGNVPHKRMVVIGFGTHSLLLENHRSELHAVVAAFLLNVSSTK